MYDPLQLPVLAHDVVQLSCPFLGFAKAHSYTKLLLEPVGVFDQELLGERPLRQKRCLMPGDGGGGGGGGGRREKLLDCQNSTLNPTTLKP